MGFGIDSKRPPAAFGGVGVRVATGAFLPLGMPEACTVGGRSLTEWLPGVLRGAAVENRLINCPGCPVHPQALLETVAR